MRWFIFSKLELVPQTKLHLPRAGQRVGVLSETTDRSQRQTERPGIEPDRIRHVERLPPELNGVPIFVGHDESLPHAGVDHKNPVTTEAIPAPGTTHERELEGPAS